jgi:hypothetical protein
MLVILTAPGLVATCRAAPACRSASPAGHQWPDELQRCQAARAAAAEEEAEFGAALRHSDSMLLESHPSASDLFAQAAGGGLCSCATGVATP